MKPRPEDLADVDGVNRRFAAEVARHDLRYRCEDCVHVVGDTGDCSLEWPNPLLRGPVEAISADGRLVFCKFFEMGEG